MRIAMPARRQHGASLIESLIAFAVLAIGLLGAIKTQASLRLGADIARQRAEAVRLGHAALEDWRSFVVLDSAADRRAYADIASDAAPIAQSAGNATYQLQRSASDLGGLKTARVAVSWLDRRGQPQQVTLHSMIAGVDPSLPLALTIPPAATAARHPRDRHAWLPLAAHDLGRGSSVFKPGGSVAWVFDNASGALTGRCAVAADATSDSLTAADVKECSSNARGFLLSGFVRFALGEAVGAADAENPTGSAMDLDIALDALSGMDAQGHSTAAAFECFDDANAPASREAVSYYCALYGPQLGAWSGRSVVAPHGWLIGSTTGTYRVCRYSADTDGDHKVSNPEHPQVYDNVSGPLGQQNFLVVRGELACPPTTLRHDPQGEPTPAQ